jgi:hypothetical protein
MGMGSVSTGETDQRAGHDSVSDARRLAVRRDKGGSVPFAADMCPASRRSVFRFVFHIPAVQVKLCGQ